MILYCLLLQSLVNKEQSFYMNYVNFENYYVNNFYKLFALTRNRSRLDSL